MNGLELSRAYFDAFGMPMLREKFPGLLPLICAGLTGSGSECYGFDDDLSRDHDMEPGFCLFLPGEDKVDRRTAFLLERAYAALPRTFEGLSRSLVAPVGGPRHGVLRIDEYYADRIGSPDGRLSLTQWLTLPDTALSEATNGEIFHDGPGLVTAIRQRLSSPPRDVFLKKLSGHLLLMAQSGQYNYARCLSHGESAAAQLAVFEFVRHTMQVIFLLNGAYQPFYKWSFRALRRLGRLSLLAELLEYLLTTDNEPEMARSKGEVIEGICQDVIRELQERQLTRAACQDLEKHAYSVHESISDPEVRHLHILAAC